MGNEMVAKQGVCFSTGSNRGEHELGHGGALWE